MGWINGKFTAFGRVIDGMTVLDQIATLKTDEKKMPVEPIILRKFKLVTATPSPSPQIQK